jgi:hypothetical protein
VGHGGSGFEVFAVAVRPFNAEARVDRVQHLFSHFAPSKYQWFFGAERGYSLIIRIETGR